MKVPNFLVIGAQLAGSTWIYDCLKQHSQVFMPDAVELLYFNNINYADEDLKQKYFSHFEGATDFSRVGEKTSGYFWSADPARSATQPPKNHNPDIPSAIRDILGSDVDFIISLQHPVWRAISAFGHHVKRNRIAKTQTLRDAAPTLGILDIGFYGAHLDYWIKAVGRSRIEVLIFEDDILPNPEAGFRKICQFLKIDASEKPDALFQSSNAGVERKIDLSGISIKGHPLPIIADDIEYLIDAYQDDINLLKSLIGRGIPSWDNETERLRQWCRVSRKADVPQSRHQPILENKAKLSPAERRLELEKYGVEASQRSVNIMTTRFEGEAPVRPSDMAMHGGCAIGAFSYGVSGDAYSTKIGRYCSIARGVNIGQFNHTMNWLSTSPFQFQQGFKFRLGENFPDKEAYLAMKPDTQLSRRALRELSRVTTIGNDVWIGNGAKITAGVNVGDGAVIGANAVVTKDVEPYAIVGGVPAKLIRYRFDEALRNRFMKVRWWQYAAWQLEGVPFADPAAALDEIERRVSEEGMKPYRPRKITMFEHGPGFVDEETEK